MTATEIAGVALVAAGLFFQFVAALGLLRFPDLYCRLHVVGINDTLGAPLVLLGACFHLGATAAAAKLLLAVLFLFMTSPLVGHMLSRAAIEAGEKPWTAPREGP